MNSLVVELIKETLSDTITPKKQETICKITDMLIDELFQDLLDCIHPGAISQEKFDFYKNKIKDYYEVKYFFIPKSK
jgi:hypothetical protein